MRQIFPVYVLEKGLVFIVRERPHVDATILCYVGGRDVRLWNASNTNKKLFKSCQS
jgi:hypothetical protein